MDSQARGLEKYLECRKPPSTMIVMYQEWKHLLFLHWEMSPEIIQQYLPDRLKVDTYNGKAYIGIVPFFMCNVRPRFLPCVPLISNFPELNLRTYVYDTETGIPGVWFFSLDAHQYLAVQIARNMFSLPYFYSKFNCIVKEENNILPKIEYSCYSINNTFRENDNLSFKSVSDEIPKSIEESSNFKYKVLDNEEKIAEQGSLSFFLVERYVLFSYSKSNNSLYMGRVHHEPYQLSNIELDRFDSNIIYWYSKKFSDEIGSRNPDNILYSKGVIVNIHSLQKI